MSRSPQVSARRRRLPTGTNSAPGSAGASASTTRAGDARDVGRQVPAGVATAFLDRAQDEHFLFDAHALERTHPAVAGRLLERIERGHAQLVVQALDRLGADPLQPEQVEDGRGKVGEQLVTERRVAGVDDFADAGGQVATDSGQGAESRLVEGGHGRRLGSDGFGGVAVRANLERVVASNLEQVPDLEEQAGDSGVVHGVPGIIMAAPTVPPPPRCMSPVHLRHQIGQLLMAGFPGTSLTVELRALAREFSLGGVVYFARNVEEPAQVAEVSREIATLTNDLPPWVSVDQEGGRVARFKRGFTLWPPMATLGRSGDVELARHSRARWRSSCEPSASRLISRLCSTSSPTRRTRDRRPRAGRAGRRCRDAWRRASSRNCSGGGIAACGKHFPGHGDTLADSHHDLPLVEHEPDRLRAVEFVPFRAAIAAGVASLMSCHVLVPAFDETRPGTLSPAIVAGPAARRARFRRPDFHRRHGDEGHRGAHAGARRLCRGHCSRLRCGAGLQRQPRPAGGHHRGADSRH